MDQGVRVIFRAPAELSLWLESEAASWWGGNRSALIRKLIDEGRKTYETKKRAKAEAMLKEQGR